MPFPFPLAACTGRRPSRLWLVGVLSGFLAASLVQAASPRDELLRFVPDDAAFCVVFQDLRTHWTALNDSPFAAQFRRSPFRAALQPPGELQKLKKILEEQLGLNWTQVRDDIFGESIVFAYRPGPTANPEQEQILLMVRSQHAKTLGDLMDRLNEIQRKSLQLKDLQTREHKGMRYYCRIETQETSYYYLRGPILLVSKQEAMLKQALECEASLAENSEPPLARHLKQLEADRALMTVWLNPRAFDAAIEARVKAKQAEGGVPKNVELCWKALDGVALSLNLDRDLSVSVAVRARLEQLPPATQKLLRESARHGGLNRLFPEDPLLAVAAHLDLVAFLEALREFLPEKRRDSLVADLNRNLGLPFGKNVVKEVLPYLGPDVGLVMVAPSIEDKGHLPHTLIALRVGVGDESAPIDKALLSCVQFLAVLVAWDHNSQHKDKPMALKTINLGGREIRYLASEAFPPGSQPAFSLHGGYLLLGSSPEAIQRLGPAPANGEPTPADSIPLVRISLKAWRTYLEQRRENLIQGMPKSEMTPGQAVEKLKQLQSVLEMFDRIELRQKTSKGLMVLSLSLQPSQPFKK
jgi:hypothetical protein